MKTSEGAGGEAVSFDPKRHYQGSFLQDTAFTGKKKSLFFLSSVPLERSWFIRWQVSNALRPIEFTLAAKFLFGTAIATLHGAARLGYREVRRLSDHAKSLTLLLWVRPASSLDFAGNFRNNRITFDHPRNLSL